MTEMLVKLDDGTFVEGTPVWTDAAEQIIADINDTLGHLAVDLLQFNVEEPVDEDERTYKERVEKWRGLQSIMGF